MSGTLLCASLCALLGSALVAASVSRRARLASAIAVAGAVIGGLCAVAAAVPVLFGGDVVVEIPLRFPTGPATLGIDALSALFLALVGFLAVPTSLYGAAYLAHLPGRSRALAHCAFNALVACMAIVLTARDGFVFFAAWEAMTLASFFLVVVEHDREDVRVAGRRYLIASQLGGACVLAFLVTLGTSAGSFGFAAMGAAAARLGALPSCVLLALAVLGFGTKAGLVPLHVWLPRAHPAAPSHVSALMSGAMIKIGVYGLLRSLLFLGPPRLAFGIAFVVAGAVTALYGIAFALGQRDLKRALAFSSIENVGLVVIGIGLSQMAAALGRPDVAVLAATGALLHALHHMLMKGGLFLAAGSVVHATGTRDVERLGGLLRRMPRTGLAFVVCAASIAALPPFCGFVGEWFLVSAAASAAGGFGVGPAVVAALALLAVVAAGALAAASSARLFGVVFLGEPRSSDGRDAHESRPLLVVPALVLAACCLAAGLFPAAGVALVRGAASRLVGATAADMAATTAATQLVQFVGLCGALVVALVVVLFLVRRALGGRRESAAAPTWGCGYARPSVRMQYTASSFGAPLVDCFSALLAPRVSIRRADALFPDAVACAVDVPDRVESGLFERAFDAVALRMAVVRRFQDGRLTRYLMFVVGTLVVGLGWAVASRWVLG